MDLPFNPGSAKKPIDLWLKRKVPAGARTHVEITS